ncbi:hypothetical protein GF325_08510 [Candidatus Bathyarchaeota archaeon]|nr:hypothetical protein [Candidatus Bathyarchaeota archaeon]
MGTQDISWKDIENKPGKKHKVRGEALLGLKVELVKREGRISDLQGQNESLEKQIGKLRDQLGQSMNNSTMLEEQVTKKGEYINRLEGRLEELKGKVEFHLQNESTLQGQLDEFKVELEGVNQVKKRLQQEKEELVQQRDELESKLFSAEARNSRMVATYLDAVAKLERDVASLEHEKELLVDEILAGREQAPQQGNLPSSKHIPTVSDESNVRACMTCKQYVLIKDGDYRYQRAIQRFEGYHRGHMLGTLTFSEVKHGFSSKTDEFLNKP